MKTKTLKTFFTLAAAGLLCAATWLATPPQTAAFEPVQGQDKAGKNCERKDTPGSSTFGKCESVCKDKEVTRDAPNNRWVCKAYKAGGPQTGAHHAPLNGQVLDASPATPKRPKLAETKADKVKKQ